MVEWLVSRVAIRPTAVCRQPRTLQGGFAVVVERTQRASGNLFAFASTEQAGSENDVPRRNNLIVRATAPIEHHTVLSRAESMLMNE